MNEYFYEIFINKFSHKVFYSVQLDNVYANISLYSFTCVPFQGPSFCTMFHEFEYP